MELDIPTEQDLGAVVERGLAFLARQQFPTGEMPCYVSPDPAMKSHCVPDSSLFGTALIASCLQRVGGPVADAMVDRAAAFIRQQMLTGGLWRFWTRNHGGFLNIPPDIDDTSCASHLLQSLGLDFPSNRELLLANRRADGLFYTWMLPRWRNLGAPSTWPVILRSVRHPARVREFYQTGQARPDDVDVVVNANVLRYLGDFPGSDKVEAYLIQTIRENNEARCDRWYHSRFAVYWALSRCLESGRRALSVIREELISRMAAAFGPDGSIGSGVQDTALALCALRACACEPSLRARPAAYLRLRQSADGSWPKEALYYGGWNETHNWGSEEVTTAFCLEALKSGDRRSQRPTVGRAEGTEFRDKGMEFTL